MAIQADSTLGAFATPSIDGDLRGDLPVDAMMARASGAGGLPGVAGLPALTEAEAVALREAATPAEALAVVRTARRRLRIHGDEARRLLQRWIDRQA